MRRRSAALAGSALFFILAPGTFAGLVPWLISRWRLDQAFGSSAWLAAAGAILILAGATGLLESFVRFAWKGLGTPAPIAPTERLIVSGLYRHVRNPMYVSVVAIVIGQALLFGQSKLLAYAALLWLGFHLFVVGYEEPALRRQFGADYERFTSAVPRWLPRLRPWQAAS